MGQILDGAAIAQEIRATIKTTCNHYREEGKRIPCLAVILVGSDPASKLYVSGKKRQTEAVGMHSKIIELPETASQNEVLEILHDLNHDDGVDGILVQLPLPQHIDAVTIVEAIDPRKDVDGLQPLNVGYLQQNRPQFIPCTPKGIMTLLNAYNVELSGKKALVIGRSQLVGKPMASLLLAHNATVTIAHSKTKNLETMISEYDLVVVAIGQPQFIKKTWLAAHQIIVDVGIHHLESGLCGDVENGALDVVDWLSPVPKGVGPMTIASLLQNTLLAYELKEHV